MTSAGPTVRPARCRAATREPACAFRTFGTTATTRPIGGGGRPKRDGTNTSRKASEGSAFPRRRAIQPNRCPLSGFRRVRFLRGMARFRSPTGVSCRRTGRSNPRFPFYPSRRSRVEFHRSCPARFRGDSRTRAFRACRGPRRPNRALRRNKLRRWRRPRRESRRSRSSRVRRFLRKQGRFRGRHLHVRRASRAMRERPLSLGRRYTSRRRASRLRRRRRVRPWSGLLTGNRGRPCRPRGPLRRIPPSDCKRRWNRRLCFRRERNMNRVCGRTFRGFREMRLRGRMNGGRRRAARAPDSNPAQRRPVRRGALLCGSRTLG